MGAGVSFWGTLLVGTSISFAEPIIHLVVVRQAGAPIDAAQRWLPLLGQLNPASLRMREGKVGDRPRVKASARGQNTFDITAILTRRNQLVVPGRSFSYGELDGIRGWMNELGADRTSPDIRESVSANTAFGLSDRQFLDLVDALGTPLVMSTKGQPVADVVVQLREIIPVRLTIDGSARRRLSQEHTVLDELQGVTAGTALAATLRPLGLAFQPVGSTRGTVAIRVRPTRGAEEVWPVGWPIEENDVVVLPKLLDRLPVEIADTPVATVLASVQPRIGVPFLIDQNGLAARRIELQNVTVSLQSRRTFYKQLLSRILFKARLEYEVRRDEADRPLIWIQPLRPHSDP